jgi:orotate phosphoribosyltransferase
LIIDDVATTMGTKFDILGQLTAEAIQKGHSYYPAGVALFLDREQTTALYDSSGAPILNQKGQNAIKNFKLKTGLEVQTILGIRETVEFLVKEGTPVKQRGQMAPLSQETVKDLYAYLDVYGV